MSAALAERAQRAAEYFRLRTEHPHAPALKLFHYARGDSDGESLREFLCSGHEFAYSGTADCGDDESFHGEGRCYCMYCGKDGDA